jgi:3-oxoacyl-[acyl-carrier-protein] synthase II
MAMYIKGMGCISPQNSWDDNSLLSQPLIYEGDKLTCYEPDYAKYIEPKVLRRMSRIIKMGVTAGMMALKEASLEIPNGIITGTAYGCLDDTGTFLNKMIENSEQALNPTPFIQSTHNTIGSQIALLLQCQGYNQTYTQGAFSFENALLDAMLALTDFPSQSLLVGAVDEITAVSHAIIRRFGIFRDGSNNLKLFTGTQNGTLHGEGAAYFALSGYRVPTDRVCLEAIKMVFNPAYDSLRDQILSFLNRNGLAADDIDFILLGKSGDKKHDVNTELISTSYFASSSVGMFKHLSGEYPTASAFALWLSAKIMAENHIPDVVVVRNENRPIKRLLILNSYFGRQHSLILLREC